MQLKLGNAETFAWSVFFFMAVASQHPASRLPLHECTYMRSNSLAHTVTPGSVIRGEA